MFPVFNYSLPIIQLIIGLLTEIFSHKLILFIGLISNFINFILLLLCSTKLIVLLQISEILTSIHFSTHISFFGLVYHLYKKENYQFFVRFNF